MTAEKELFTNKGYCSANTQISRELLDFVTQYAFFDEQQNFTPDTGQVIGAHSRYADPAMEVMLLHLKNFMQNSTGLDLYPTYSFYRVYRPGDELKIHKDRPSCEISCTVCFNYNYDTKNDLWPIYMDGTPVYQEPGDAVIYRGCDLDHWRPVFKGSQAAWQVQGFFHYVDANGPFANYKYDGRESIGTNKKELPKKSYITFL